MSAPHILSQLGARTVEDALARWDAGEAIWSVEMGGLGPGYEQCIQVLAVELLREYRGKPLPDKGAWDGWGDDVARRLDADVGGFSGAQVGAAKSLAARILKIGYGEAMDEMRALDADRMIQVSNRWPHASTSPANPALVVVDRDDPREGR